MKSFLLFIALLCAVTLSSSSAPSVTNAANAAKKERAVMKFNQPVKLMGVTLKGEYLFVHDDEAMARGEACTFVYKGRRRNSRQAGCFFSLQTGDARQSEFTALLCPSRV